MNFRDDLNQAVEQLATAVVDEPAIRQRLATYTARLRRPIDVAVQGNGDSRTLEPSGESGTPTVLDDDKSLATWARLPLADMCVLVCRGELTHAQQVALRAAAKLGVKFNPFLFQADGDARMARRNAHAVETNGIQPLVVAAGRGAENVRDLVARLTSRETAAQDRLLVSLVLEETPQLVTLHDLERDMLADLTSETMFDRVHAAADMRRQSFDAASRRRDAQWRRIDQESSLELDRLFQSAGPIMQILDSELQLIPYVSTGWDTYARRFEEAVVVVTGMAMAWFLQQVAGRAERLAAEMFGQMGLSQTRLVLPAVVSVGSKTPSVESLPVWSTFLGGAIKYYISNRTSENLVPHTRFGIVNWLSSWFQKLLGLATAADQHRKAVQDHFRNEASLKALPYLSCEVTPVLRNVMSDMGNYLQMLGDECLRTFVDETDNLAGRCRQLLNPPDDCDAAAMLTLAREVVGKSLIEIPAARDNLARAVERLDAEISERGSELSELAVFSDADSSWTADDSVGQIQRDAICSFVAQTIEKQFSISGDKAKEIARKLVADESDGGAELAEPISSASWDAVAAAVLGVEVTFEQTGPSTHRWRRTTRIFLRDGSEECTEVAQTAALCWLDLPGEIRDARMNFEETRQRFVFGGPQLARV